MKRYYNLLVILFFALIIQVGFNGCEGDIDSEVFAPEAVDFTFTSPSIHFVQGEEITFINLSAVGSSWEWNFGDGTTSTEKNPVHKYQKAGTYKVTLSVDGGEFETHKSIMISEIIPYVTFTSEDAEVIYNQTEVSFNVLLENPEDKQVVYNWSFPKGTVGEGIDENGKTTVKEPSVIFSRIGSQKATLTVTLGEDDLLPVTVNVRVNYDQPAKTLYYAVKDGNIMARKLIAELDPEINDPFNLGYRSGKHPLTLDFAGDWLYVFDAGTKTGYVADFQNAGDGEIFVVAHDGSKRESVIENFGGDTFLDFYYGYVDEQENMIYWADRREGIFRMPAATRNSKFSFNDYDYFVRNNWLGYYGKGISWGNTNGPITKFNDLYWWAKNSTGAGIFRFNSGDILGRAKEDTDPVPAAGQFFASGTYKVRGMVIDEVNGHVYVADQGRKAILKFDINSGERLAIVDLPKVDSGEGGEAELLFVTGMAIDVDAGGNGYLYWAYRGPADNEDPNLKSGIKRYKLNDPAAQAEYFIEGVEAYGIAIDQSMR